jgi:NAD(P)-dependent dehydrogenase (short-subunit alcohol dehydrogenase family)
MQNKPVALVIGANKGIGLQIAKYLAAHGFTVLIGSRNLEQGETAAKSVGAHARALQLDVTSQASSPPRQNASGTSSAVSTYSWYILISPYSQNYSSLIARRNCANVATPELCSDKQNVRRHDWSLFGLFCDLVWLSLGSNRAAVLR